MFDVIQKNIVRGLMAGLFLLWLVFGIITLQGDLLLGILMIMNSLCFGVFAFLCKSKNRILKWLLYIFVALNAILTFTDKMGLFDWIMLVVYVLLIVFMIFEDVRD